MPFEHGHPKYGGRQPGSGKSRLLALLRERYPDFHPLIAMLEMYHDPTTPADIRRALLNDVASYTLPKLKPVELTEMQRSLDETISVLPDGNPIDTFIQAFLNGQLSATDLATLTAALAIKQKAQGQTIDEQAELLKLIKS